MGSINSNNLVYYINYIQVHPFVIGKPDSDIVKPGRFHCCFPHFLLKPMESAFFMAILATSRSPRRAEHLGFRPRPTWQRRPPPRSSRLRPARTEAPQAGISTTKHGSFIGEYHGISSAKIKV